MNNHPMGLPYIDLVLQPFFMSKIRSYAQILGFTTFFFYVKDQKLCANSHRISIGHQKCYIGTQLTRLSQSYFVNTFTITPTQIHQSLDFLDFRSQLSISCPCGMT